jgi:hypothetical protein
MRTSTQARLIKILSWRRLAIAAMSFALAGCWHPRPTDMDPTRYPWDQRWLNHPRIEAVGAVPRLDNPAPGQIPSGGTYCVVSLEIGSTNGITVGGAPLQSACAIAPSPAPPKR